MTQEDKELLLKDLCARFPYKVICRLSGDGAEITEQLQLGGLGQFMYGRIDVKPYLRPMSSMTEEELREFKTLEKQCESLPTFAYISVSSCILFDWLNSHHFDYRGLIECGLAIEVTEENNPYKE